MMIVGSTDTGNYPGFSSMASTSLTPATAIVSQITLSATTAMTAFTYPLPATTISILIIS